MFHSGDVIGGRYRLEKCIGRGGMAEVWLASQAHLFGRKVAVKFMLSMSEDQSMTQRFKGEATALAKLDHRAICDLLDFGEDRGVLYLVMAFVDGFDLSRIVRPGGIPIPLALYVVSEVLQALKHAHARGVIHRDIKPANILVSREGDILITDFGIAKTVQPGFDPSISTVAAGSPGFMAPEILRGRAPCFQSDLFAVGVLLFALLVGRSPFVPENAERDAIFYSTLNDPVPSLASLGIAAPAVVDHLIQRALEKDPLARYGSAAEFLDELIPILSSYGTEGTSLAWTRRIATDMQTMPVMALSEEVASPPRSSMGVSRMAGQLAPEGQAAAATSGRPRSRRRWAIAVATASAILTGAGAVAILMVGRNRPLPDPRPASAPVQDTSKVVVWDAAVAPRPVATPPDASVPATAELDISVEPAGATVTIDGTVLPGPPFQVQGLAPGSKVRVRVERRGYTGYEQTIDVDAARVRLPVVLVPIAEQRPRQRKPSRPSNEEREVPSPTTPILPPQE